MKIKVAVTQVVEVTLDESKFDADFMAEFVQHFFPIDTIHEHAEHLAQLYARGIYDNGDFIEGYGDAKDMGIKFSTVDQYEEVMVE